MCIYALLDPISTLIVYIGQTNNPKQRLELHKIHHGGKYTAGARITEYMGLLIKRGLEPEMVILESEGIKDYPAREAYWIVQAFRSGAPLLNTVVPKAIEQEFWQRNRTLSKRCSDCRLTLPNTLEYFNPINMFDGLHWKCKMCQSLKRRKK